MLLLSWTKKGVAAVYIGIGEVVAGQRYVPVCVGYTALLRLAFFFKGNKDILNHGVVTKN
jgi:hypothetical protein